MATAPPRGQNPVNKNNYFYPNAIWCKPADLRHLADKKLFFSELKKKIKVAHLTKVKALKRLYKNVVINGLKHILFYIL